MYGDHEKHTTPKVQTACLANLKKVVGKFVGEVTEDFARAFPIVVLLIFTHTQTNSSKLRETIRRLDPPSSQG